MRPAQVQRYAWDALAAWMDDAPTSTLEALSRGGEWRSVLPRCTHKLFRTGNVDVAALAQQESERWHRRIEHPHRICRMMTPSDLAHYRERFFTAKRPEDLKALLDELAQKYPDPDDVMARSFGSEVAMALANERPRLLGLDDEGQVLGSE